MFLQGPWFIFKSRAHPITHIRFSLFLFFYLFFSLLRYSFFSFPPFFFFFLFSPFSPFSFIFLPLPLGGPDPPMPPRGPGLSTLWRVSTPVSGPEYRSQRSNILPPASAFHFPHQSMFVTCSHYLSNCSLDSARRSA